LPFSLFTQENIAMDPENSPYPLQENSFEPRTNEIYPPGVDLAEKTVDPRTGDYRNDQIPAVMPVTIAVGGTGYAINDTGTFAGGVIYKVTAIGENGAVTAVSISPQHLRLLNDRSRANVATTVTTGSGDGTLRLNLTARDSGQRVLHANPFFLSRTKATHYGDQIQFATHPNRSLSIFDATVLCAWLAFLIDDDKAVSVELDNLRQRPYVKAVAAPHEVENMDMSLGNAPIPIDYSQTGTPAPVENENFDNSPVVMPETIAVAEAKATQERNNEKTIAQTQSQESNTAQQRRAPRRTGTV